MTYYEKRYKANEIEFGVNPNDDLEAVVSAAQWLDDNRRLLGLFTEWRDHINPDLLDMSDPRRCIIGQAGVAEDGRVTYADAAVHIDHAEDQGLLVPYTFCSSDIEETWRQYIIAHRLVTHA